jgi:hypothetical protein
MQFHTIVSAFYLDSSFTVPDLGVLVRRVGVREVRPFSSSDRIALGFDEADREVLGGTWDVFQETWAVLDVVEGLICLQLYSPLVRFLDATREDREDKPGGQMAYVGTFADACRELYPSAAFLDTRAHYEDKQWREQEGNRDWVRQQAKLVAADDINALADERVSVLYLSEPATLGWSSDPVRDNRDIIEHPTGRLYFARRGPARMA